MEKANITLDEQEKKQLEEFQTRVHQVIIDLGKVELQLSDLETIKSQIKSAMAEIVEEQNSYFQTLEEKYGKGVVDPKTFEYIQD
jgi:flagellar biosynthesis chaperone FliJ